VLYYEKVLAVIVGCLTWSCEENTGINDDKANYGHSTRETAKPNKVSCGFFKAAFFLENCIGRRTEGMANIEVEVAVHSLTQF
jgi:hypothetical protein